MKDGKNRELLGKVCIFLGGIFVLAGLVFFIINNHINMYAKKVSATALSSVSITTSDGKERTMLELLYKVGDENITTTYDYDGVLQEGEVFLEVYYDVREPKRIIDAGWTFEPLFMALLGLIVLLLGLYYKGVTDFGIVEMKEPDKDAPERVKKTYVARQKVGNSIFPILGGIVFVAFGLVMVFTRGNNWMWIFVGVGGLVILYFATLLIPALIELRQLKIAKKFRGTVVDRDDLEIKKKGKKTEEKEEEKAEDKEPEKEDAEEGK
jgi:hypothetical protein